jgi:hypothetical protein
MTQTKTEPQYVDPQTQCRVTGFFRYPDPALGETRQTVLDEVVMLPLSLAKELEHIGQVQVI